MVNNTHFYCVGFTWSSEEPENQLPRFLKEGIWENGFDDKYLERVARIPEGSRIAAKTTYTEKRDGVSVSVLEIYATGTVVKNFHDGRRLKVKWDRQFKPFKIIGKGAYRSTISRINSLNTVKEIFRNQKETVSDEINFYRREKFKREDYLLPCFVLNKNRWDDFGYSTQYEVEYYNEEGQGSFIGFTKFFDKNNEENELPWSFTSLGDEICSLGQSNEYYENIREILDKEVSEYYFEAVNDVAINRGVLDDFEHEHVFKVSLLRSSEAQKALKEGYRIYKDLPIDNVLKFNFSTDIGNALKPHSIDFDFTEIDDLPFRIKVLIGKNGTGKTQFISRLSSTLSGYKEEGSFSTTHLPPFSRVIAVSYSLFDRFPKPQQTRTYSYYYCGFQGARGGFLSPNQIQARLKKAFSGLEKSKRLDVYGDCLSKVLSDELALQVMDEDFIEFNPKEFVLYDKEGNSNYSSGQIIMILMLAEVIAYIRDESLLLFDEPETHLHPNSISRFINVINTILKKFNSYAIITTHSPQIVQEVPSKDVVVLERISDVPSVRKLDLESFGENLNTITERIFHTINHDEYYREVLLRLSKNKDYDEVLRIFDKNSLTLSFSAKIYLQSIYKK